MSHRYDTSLKISELKFQSGERVVSRSTDTRSFSYVSLSLICTYLTYYLLYIDCLLMSVNCSLVTSIPVIPVRLVRLNSVNRILIIYFSVLNSVNRILTIYFLLSDLVDRFSVLFIILFLFMLF